MSADAKPDQATLQRAAQWYARLRASNADNALHQHWQQWLEQHESHRTAWAFVERISQRFEPLQSQADASVQALQSARHRLHTRRRTLGTLSLLCGGALLGWTSWRHQLLPHSLLALGSDVRTGVGEIHSRQLVDGTRIWLNGDSALNVDYQSGLRRLQLLSGEVLIETARDSRPFVIDSAQGRMQALGTRFSVLQREHDTRLNVFDGAVRIAPYEGTAGTVVTAGKQIDFDRQGNGLLVDADPSRQAWSQGQLLANDITLAAFIDELQRYQQGYLGVSAAAGELRVVGNFPANDPARALKMLEGALPIRISQPLPWWTSIELR
ncbi:MAG: FecR domain-containing protein [Pseudomonas sp.]